MPKKKRCCALPLLLYYAVTCTVYTCNDVLFNVKTNPKMRFILSVFHYDKYGKTEPLSSTVNG